MTLLQNLTYSHKVQIIMVICSISSFINIYLTKNLFEETGLGNLIPELQYIQYISCSITSSIAICIYSLRYDLSHIFTITSGIFLYVLSLSEFYYGILMYSQPHVIISSKHRFWFSNTNRRVLTTIQNTAKCCGFDSVGDSPADNCEASSTDACLPAILKLYSTTFSSNGAILLFRAFACFFASLMLLMHRTSQISSSADELRPMINANSKKHKDGEMRH